ncbi:MAG: hypothetical protein F6K16_33385, partial [Symploca sp. SIO2B6]|nr:hypothetical protein [Symploca sp. SIO2B6]
GMDDYISKPIRFNILAQALTRCVSSSKSHGPDTQQAAQQFIATPEPTLNGDVSLLDYKALQNTIDTMGMEPRECLSTLLDIFLDESKSLIETMQSAISEHDGNKLNFAAHTLKSSSASLGVRALSLQCQRLEKMGLEGDLTQAETIMSDVQALYEKVEPALSQYMLEVL